MWWKRWKARAGVWFIRGLCYDKLNQVQPARMRIGKFLDFGRKPASGSVWQANQRINVLEKRREEERTGGFPRGRGSVSAGCGFAFLRRFVFGGGQTERAAGTLDAQIVPAQKLRPSELGALEFDGPRKRAGRAIMLPWA